MLVLLLCFLIQFYKLSSAKDPMQYEEKVCLRILYVQSDLAYNPLLLEHRSLFWQENQLLTFCTK